MKIRGEALDCFGAMRCDAMRRRQSVAGRGGFRPRRKRACGDLANEIVLEFEFEFADATRQFASRRRCGPAHASRRRAGPRCAFRLIGIRIDAADSERFQERLVSGL
ncbi:hypothetical protein WS91_10665 [Burkholderia sp. MSMB1498]|nr:hypothetical protein WS91_10665 [Burkholderia sp. MSMB1498]